MRAVNFGTANRLCMSGMASSTTAFSSSIRSAFEPIRWDRWERGCGMCWRRSRVESRHHHQNGIRAHKNRLGRGPPPESDPFGGETSGFSVTSGTSDSTYPVDAGLQRKRRAVAECDLLFRQGNRRVKIGPTSWSFGADFIARRRSTSPDGQVAPIHSKWLPSALHAWGQSVFARGADVHESAVSR